MVKVILLSVAVLACSCTVNVYDYSSHSHAGAEPDTVYAEPAPPAFPSTPDTVITRRALSGTGGVVVIESAGGWTRYTLKDCLIETDGVAFETGPMFDLSVSEDGVQSTLFQIAFMMTIQDYMFGSDQQSVFAGQSTPEGTVLPVVTGTRLLSLVADRTSFPFLVEEASLFESDWLPGGTVSCRAVFPVADWEMRIICSAEQLAIVSDDPEYRIVFGDNERRQLQQFYDIFVVHHGDPPALPVQGIRAEQL